VWEDWKEKRNAECMSSTNDEFVVVPENMVAMRPFLSKAEKMSLLIMVRS
jgi:hypothetical protein